MTKMTKISNQISLYTNLTNLTKVQKLDSRRHLIGGTAYGCERIFREECLFGDPVCFVVRAFLV